MFVYPKFLTDLKLWKTYLAFFVFFWYSILHFEQNCWNKFFSKCIVIVPKDNCVGTEGICVYPIHVSTRLFDVTYLDIENCMIYFLQNPDLKKKKKKKRLTYRPSKFSGQKGKQTLHRVMVVSYKKTQRVGKWMLTIRRLLRLAHVTHF